MKGFRFATRIITLVALVSILASTVGVYAVWTFTSLDADDQEETLPVIMFPWDYEEESEGNDHLWLIDSIINGEIDGVKVGLNGDAVSGVTESWGVVEANDGSELNQEVAEYEAKNRVYVGSMGTLAADNLERLFGARSANVKWILYFPNGDQPVEGNTMYLFTTSEALENSNGRPIGGKIYPIYRTTIVYTNGEWKRTMIEVGNASSAYYVEKYTGGIGGAWLTQNGAWDPSTWTQGVPTS